MEKGSVKELLWTTCLSTLLTCGKRAWSKGQPRGSALPRHLHAHRRDRCRGRLRVSYRAQQVLFWPVIRDFCWYSFESVVYITDEPMQVTKNRRHFQVDPTIWRLFSDD
ncbi:hypothetical protein LSAT2_025803 [Lamellibrachia satsuma]|nr:hypothetical protein LSAT2_025803 [Lamellibrachia satsuma]